MQKILVLSVLASSLLFSQEKVDIIKQKGMAYFKANNFQLAIEEFTKIDNYNQSSNIDFYLARSYYELGMYEKALIAYERVLINEPDNKRAQLEIAQTYLMLNSLEIAKISFLELKSDPTIPQVVKDNIENRLKFIDEKTKKHFFASTLMFGWGYDDNIENNNTNKYLGFAPDYGANLENPSPYKTKSSFYETALMFNHMYKYDENIALKNSLVFYKQDFTKDQTKQLDLVSFNTTPMYQIDNISYGVTFGIDNVLYGDNRYLNNYSLTPKISYLIDDTKMYETSIKFLTKKFVQEVDEKSDSWIYEYQNKLMIQTQNYGMFDVSLTLARENKDNLQPNTNVAKDYETISLGNNYKIDKELTLNSSISYNNVNYHEENIFKSKRADDIYSLNLGLSYSYDKDLTFGLNYSYVRQDSNQTSTDYDKNTVKTSIYYSF